MHDALYEVHTKSFQKEASVQSLCVCVYDIAKWLNGPGIAKNFITSAHGNVRLTP